MDIELPREITRLMDANPITREFMADLRHLTSATLRVALPWLALALILAGGLAVAEKMRSRPVPYAAAVMLAGIADTVMLFVQTARGFNPSPASVLFAAIFSSYFTAPVLLVTLPMAVVYYRRFRKRYDVEPYEVGIACLWAFLLEMLWLHYATQG